MMLRPFASTFLLLVLLEAAGCQFGDEPRYRLGCYPTSTIGTRYYDPNDLGLHSYNFSSAERNGIVYTCKAGHVDITHVRIAADWTKFLANKTFQRLMKNDKEFSYRMNTEPTRCFVKITYPDYWTVLTREYKEQIARTVSIKLGQYLTFTSTSWHEILTWFDFKVMGPFPEFPSAFSWEDSFSNLLGAHIAGRVLLNGEDNFDKAITLAIQEELNNLGAQSASTARLAAEKMRGKWFTGQFAFLVDIKKRNFDIGIDDGYITPTVVPSVPGCEGVEPQLYPVPNLDVFPEYGFSIKLELEPREWEKDKILKIVYPDASPRRRRIEPVIHFAPIMDYIRKDAEKRYGTIKD
jgi:hypothetical protein